MLKQLGCIVLTGFIFSCSTKKETPEAGPAGPKPQQVEVVIAGTSSVDNNIAATGSVMANEEIELRSEISGRITGLFFNEGERVAGGKLLVQIDNSELKAELKKTGLEIELAAEDVARKKKLLDGNGISKEEYDIAQNNLMQLQAQQELIEAQLNKTSIYAPFSGAIGLRSVSEGGFVSPNNIIAVLQQTDPVKVEFSVPEKYAATLKNGTTVNFSVEGDTNIYTARVYAKEPAIDPSTRTVKVRATCGNSNNALIPGAFAKLLINLGTMENTIVLPSGTLVAGLNGQNVMLVKNGAATLTPVNIGIRTENNTQITNGITPGDTVIVSGLLTVRNGMKVIPVISTDKK